MTSPSSTAVEISSTNPCVPPKKDTASILASAKIHAAHVERLAIVYIRQSTPQQVSQHRESRLRQYAFTDRATALGWLSDRVLVIDEDLGLSGRTADARQGFQRLLSEVTLDHVGIVLGLEMSRLARSSKDWHHLFELCGVFGTLLADEDGVYDPNDPNDRLILGLKGIMSEMELLLMRNRLHRGMLNKAHRGELFFHVPVGYVKSPTGMAALEPDEQVRNVVHLIFDKFDELGSGHAVYHYLRRHGIRIGVRPIVGPNRGQLEWRPVCEGTIFSILKHPLYAGAYVFGRCPVVPKRKQTHKVARKWVPSEQWQVLLHDRAPAYISWDRYLANQQRLKTNRTGRESKGFARRGSALLSGIVFCGQCGRRLSVTYGQAGHPRYDCIAFLHKHVENRCPGVSAPPVDALVGQQVLRALEPASLELSVQATENIHAERQRLTKHWQQELERAQYEAGKAERHYRAVDPENRLVARTLEQEWETALSNQRGVQEEFDRFQCETPLKLSAAEQDQIRALANDIPGLWNSATTSHADRKQIVRGLIERVVINVRGETEHLDVSIHWAGGFVSEHAVIRPVQRYQQLEDYDRLKARLVELRNAGRNARQIGDQLNQEGFRTPTARRTPFTKNKVNQLLALLGMSRRLLPRDSLAPNEWWLLDLAAELQIHPQRLRHWIRHGYVNATKRPSSKYWLLWADEDELNRLRVLRDYLKTEQRVPYPPELTRPKPRPTPEAASDDATIDGAKTDTT